MDPYLEDEKLWPSFQHQFVTCLYQLLLPGLINRYRACISERRYAMDPPSEASGCGEERREEYVEIWEANDGRLVTLVDVVSPPNKTTDSGRWAYLHTRQQGRDGRANVVEIDLVMQGQPTLEYSREGLPDWDCAVTVTRSTQPERYEIYTATLRKRLPRFRLPLAADNRDTVLDLQDVFTRAYEQGAFAAQIDYRREPAVPLTEVKRRWLGELLQWPSQPVGASLTHDEIALTAYAIWKEQGCPDGRADEHWRLAIERLKQARALTWRGTPASPGPPAQGIRER
jgi:hypothetical protein